MFFYLRYMDKNDSSVQTPDAATVFNLRNTVFEKMLALSHTGWKRALLVQS